MFFNQTLAFDEIDRLFDAKAFSKFSRYTADGKQAVGEIKRHFDGFLKGVPAENLIIKGNNLIALHSLAKQFKGRVKLIYIDPPYYFRKKKKDDSFGYNSNFKLSTWLTFMKNRLEIAKQLMTEDGLIFVSIDEDGQAYLRILMDEIFGRENYITDLIRKTKSSTNDANTGANVQHENCLIFALQKENTDVLGGEKDLSSYSNPDNDPNGDWKSSDPSAKSGKQENNWFAVENPYTGQIDYPPQGRFWLFSKNSIKKHLENGTIVFKKEIKEGERGFIYKKYKNKLKTQLKTLNSLIATDNTCMNQVGTKELSELDLPDDLKNPKPENFIKLIIEHATDESDIVLDYHLGSGTTAAVAHKMNRQYIGIEQMDYIETLAVERMKKVIDGEQGGISKAVNWQGGGEFVYAELAPFNETAKQQILACESSDDIKTLFNKLCERYFLKYNVSVDEFSQIIEEPEFQSLPLDEQKQMMLEMLDLNQMYVSLSEMDDEQFVGCLNDDDKALSRAFYQSVKNQAEKKDGE
ncbi:TPA: site-specific DNA-methyltransferase [Haemophilus influenzae]